MLTILNELEEFEFDKEKIIYQTLKSPKRGGQHVNRNCSGVRAIYLPLNIEAISFDERSQYLNKKLAKARLLKKLDKLKQNELENWQQSLYESSKEIQRGQEILKFIGEEFRVAKS